MTTELAFARDWTREARFTVWPMGVYSIWVSPVLIGTHDDFAGIHPRSDLESAVALATQAVAVAPNLILETERRIEGALRMILVRDRRAKEREDAVPRRLHDMAVIAAYGVDHELQGRIDDGAGFLRVEILLEPSGVDDVDEKRCDELPFAHRHEICFDRLAEGDTVAALSAPHLGRQRIPH